MDDVSRLVHSIVSGTDSGVKRQSECDLNGLFVQQSFWADRANIDALMVCDDTVLFFMCKGMQKYLWKSWSISDSAQIDSIQQRLQSQVMNVLYTRSLALQPFARSKVEQLLGTFCILSLSLDSITAVITAITSSSGSSDGCDNVKVCLSILRTCFEDILNTNSKISPEKSKTLNKIIEDLTPQLVNFTVASMIIGGPRPNVSIADVVKDEQLLLMAIEFLKVAIAKVRVGPHLSNDLLNLLFILAENTATFSNGRTTSSTPSPAVVAVEALSELMSKNYLPNSDNILTEILIKAIMLFKNVIRSGSSTSSKKSILDSLAITAPMLEFILLFCENHLNRCLRANNSSIRQQIPSFLQEITTITLSIYDINLVPKIISIWESILSIETVADYVTGTLSASISIPVLDYLLMTCLVLRNDNLQEYVDDMEEGLVVEPITDVHLREIVDHLRCGGADGKAAQQGAAVEGAEEAADAISAIRGGYLRLLGLFYSHGCATGGHNDTHAWLVSTVPPMMQELIDKVSGAGDDAYAAAIDVAFIVRVLPLCCDRADLFLQLINLSLHLMNNRMYSRGKMFTNIIVCSNEVIAQILRAYRGLLFKDAQWDGVFEFADALNRDPEYVAARGIVEKSFQLLQTSFQLLALATDSSVSPPPSSIMATAASLVLCVLTTLGRRSRLAQGLAEYLQLFYKRLPLLPLEIQALLVCIADLVAPGEVAVTLSQQIRSVIASAGSDGRSVVYNIGQGALGSNVLSDPATLALLCRSCGCLDALSKFHSSSLPSERQTLVSNLLLLKDSVKPLAEHVFASLRSLAAGTGASATNSRGAHVTAAKLLISLSCSLVQSLGTRSFGPQALEMLLVCEQHLTEGGLGLRLIEDGIGLALMKQVLQLVIVIAQSSAAATADAGLRISSSMNVLGIASKALGDSYICSELLYDVLRTGVIITNSYWPGGAFSAAPPPPLIRTVTLVVELCVDSLAPTIPPQAVLAALEGLYSLGAKHNLYGLWWFQQMDCYGKLLAALVRCVLFRQHATYSEETILLLSAMTTSGSSPGLWDFVGSVIANVAAEGGCAATARELLAGLAGRGIRNIDISHFNDVVLTPLAMQIEIQNL